MADFHDLKEFFAKQNITTIIAADAEGLVHKKKNGELVTEIPGGGVGVALEPVAKASNAYYVARGKTEEDKMVLRSDGTIPIVDDNGSYTLKRLFLNDEEMEDYYFGFSNQTLWPLCHVTFEQPEFHRKWFEGYKKINQKFAAAIKPVINGKTFIWIHDYQLALVPKLLDAPKNTIISMFWHIPWPTWEAFRILPQKNEILEGLLACDFLAFHRGYQARNFLETVRRELEVRIDEETSTVYYKNHKTVVKSMPLGIDVDVIRNLIQPEEKETFLSRIIKSVLPFEDSIQQKESNNLNGFFEKHKVIIGVDRLDYTKGLKLRLRAIERFLENNPQYIQKVVYLGILSPSREQIPSYQRLKKEVKALAHEINLRFARKGWLPIYLINSTFPRRELINFYQKSDLCLVTPRDDGMNLVSKEFVVASSMAEDPGMLVLSRFAGSAIDLTESLIVNPYDMEEVAIAMKKGLEMSPKEKIARIKTMVTTLEQRNMYQWAEDFVREALSIPK